MLTEQRIKEIEAKTLARIAASQKSKAPKIVITRDEERKANDLKIAQLKAKLAAYKNGTLNLSKFDASELAGELENAWNLAACF